MVCGSDELGDAVPFLENLDDAVRGEFAAKKARILELSRAKQAEECLEAVYDLWMFMNRFRNCDLRIYFDQDIHEAIFSLADPKNLRRHEYRRKPIYKVAFITFGFNDLGGASLPHRFMLPNFGADGAGIKNYFLITNFFRQDIVPTESQEYLEKVIRPEELCFVPKELSHVERADFIRDWLIENKIDFVVANADPSVLLALASRPCPIQTLLNQDCYTFALGHGASCFDMTFLVMLEQVFSYSRLLPDAANRLKVVMLPLPPTSYAEDAVPLTKAELGFPEHAVVSASSNMWKTFFGDTETLLYGIATLARRYPRYRHVFVGTPRCRDSLDFFVNRNPDVKDNIRYVGPVKNIYRLLKTIDFWVNSFPTSGGSDIEAALVGKPTIELTANRNLNLHPSEFLCSPECTVTSLDEFIQLGGRFIEDSDYRAEVGEHLRRRTAREFDQAALTGRRIYAFLVEEYGRLAGGRPRMPQLNVRDSLDYEKIIAFYSAYGRTRWTSEEKRTWLEQVVRAYPDRPFGWIKLLETAFVAGTYDAAGELESELAETLLCDYRVRTLLMLNYEAAGRAGDALRHARGVAGLQRLDDLSCNVATRLLAEAGCSDEAKELEQARGSRIAHVAAPPVRIEQGACPVYYDY
jgi:hypothetical protein